MERLSANQRILPCYVVCTGHFTAIIGPGEMGTAGYEPRVDLTFSEVFVQMALSIGCDADVIVRVGAVFGSLAKEALVDESVCDVQRPKLECCTRIREMLVRIGH